MCLLTRAYDKGVNASIIGTIAAILVHQPRNTLCVRKRNTLINPGKQLRGAS